MALFSSAEQRFEKNLENKSQVGRFSQENESSHLNNVSLSTLERTK